MARPRKVIPAPVVKVDYSFYSNLMPIITVYVEYAGETTKFDGEYDNGRLKLESSDLDRRGDNTRTVVYKDGVLTYAHRVKATARATRLLNAIQQCPEFIEAASDIEEYGRKIDRLQNARDDLRETKHNIGSWHGTTSWVNHWYDQKNMLGELANREKELQKAIAKIREQRHKIEETRREIVEMETVRLPKEEAELQEATQEAAALRSTRTFRKALASSDSETRLALIKLLGGGTAV